MFLVQQVPVGYSRRRAVHVVVPAATTAGYPSYIQNDEVRMFTPDSIQIIKMATVEDEWYH